MREITFYIFLFCLFTIQLRGQSGASILPPSAKIKPETKSSKLNLANHHIQMIKEFTYVENIDSSIYHFNKAVQLGENLENKEIVAKANIKMGDALIRKQNLQNGKDYLEKGLQLSKDLNDSKLLSETYRILGNFHWELSNLKEALSFYNKSKQYAEQSGDSKLMGLTLNSVGILYISLNEYEKALGYLKEALVSVQQSNFEHGELLVINNIGWAYLGMEDYESAIKVLEDKVIDGKFSDDKILNLWALTKYGKALIETGEVGRGFEMIVNVKEEASRLKIERGVDEIIILLASSYLKFDLIDQTIETALEGIDRSIEGNKVKYLPTLYAQLAEAYDKKKEYKKSLSAIKKSKIAKEELLKKEKAKEVLGLEMQHQIQQKEAENELLQLKNTNQKIYIGFLITLFLLFSSFLYFYFLIKQRKQINHFKQRISEDLHDDVAGNLSAISRIAKGLKSEINSNEVNLKINQLVKKSNESVKNVVDVIWSLSEDESQLGHLIDKLEDQLDLIKFNDKNVKVELNKKGLDENILLPMNVRHHLLMIFKESINNIQKHTESNLVEINLTGGRKKLEISIFNQFHKRKENSISSGRGIENIKRRVKELKGHVDITKTSNSFLVKLVVNV